MKLQFIGANHEVTGSCHYLQAGTVLCWSITEWNRASTGLKTAPLPVPVIPDQFCVFNACPYRSFRHAAAFVRTRLPRQDLYTEATADLCSICSGTAPTFSSRRRSGKAGRQNAMPESKWRSRCIRWRMRSAPSTVSYHARMGKNWK